MSRVKTEENKVDWETMMQKLLGNNPKENSGVKERFIVRFNDKIIPIKTSEIAYFYSEDKSNFLMTKSGASYVVDASLNEIGSKLDSTKFFKISRNCILAMSAIKSITKQIGDRLKIESIPVAPFDMTVSRARCDEFLRWLEK